MKVYTKTGDRGTTALIGGRRVEKSHPRIDAYGTIDELMAYTGLLFDQLKDEEQQKTFLEIQDRLMTASSLMAFDGENNDVILPQIEATDITFLEKSIDNMEKELTPLQSFILPGGHTVVSFCHIARTVCRRAERLCIKVIDEYGGDKMVVKYLNRLSDFYFVFARKLAKDLNVKEISWKARS